ncbi:MAG: hypothetical protein KJ571_06935 [Bacteroidetes bacterium]|nr:hypothetical protein [Bacteroidota bacterium]
MPQEQRYITLTYLDNTQSHATATGNNASWNCICGFELPLIGRTGNLEGPSDNTIVECPKCNRRFYVYPELKDQGRAIRVLEVKNP